MGAYGGGFNRYRPDTQSAVTGPTGSTSGDLGREAGREQMLEQQQRQQQTTAEMGAYRQATNTAAAADQAKSIEDYRTARDNSQQAQNDRETRQEATALGIDPSSSARDVADSLNGGMGTTPFNLDPTQPPAATPGVVQATPESIRNAVVTKQAAKDGAQAQTQAGAYAQGANAVAGPAPTSAAPAPATGPVDAPATAPVRPPTVPTTPALPFPAQKPRRPMTAQPLATT